MMVTNNMFYGSLDIVEVNDEFSRHMLNGF